MMNQHWQLTYNPNFRQLGEPGLTLHKHNSTEALRRWVGPLATRLINRLAEHTNQTAGIPGTKSRFNISKQLAQHLLIEASFQHQFCLHHFQVIQDLQSHRLQTGSMEELLLYLRMTSQHPCHEDVLAVMSLIQPDNSCCEEQLITLQERHLIQKIAHRNTVFYDKNPLPHAHVYDPEQGCLYDHHSRLDCTRFEFIRGWFLPDTITAP